MNLASYLQFAWAGLVRHPQTGGIIPSQRFLVDKMIEPIPLEYCGEIVELGAGSGALTLRLASRCQQARIVACEVNPTLARHAMANLANPSIQGRVEVRAASAEQILSERLKQGKKARYIISGIPLGNLGQERALHTIRLIGRALTGTGLYIQFQHSLLDRKKIRAHFSRFRTVPVFLNFPPAVVYYAQGPIVRE